MGLIPIAADARLFDYHISGKDYTPNDSLKFRLHKKCTKKVKDAPMIINSEVKEEDIYNHSNVYSGDLEWIPEGD